jgi:RHS repeat-associated protein
MTYDVAGNISDDDTREYTINTAGQLAEIEISSVTVGEYVYDANNLRIKKTASATDTYYVYGQGGLLYGEYDSSGDLIREYVYLNGEPLAQIDDGEVLTYLHTDHLGTPRYGTNTSGTQVWAWDSDVFGNGIPTGTATVNLRLSGQYWDDESDLHYNWNRYYNPETGRYVSSDPIGLSGGLNTYLYANANPAMFTDPEGLTVWTGKMSTTFALGEIFVFSMNLTDTCNTVRTSVWGYGGERDKNRTGIIDPKKKPFTMNLFLEYLHIAKEAKVDFDVEFVDANNDPSFSKEFDSLSGYWIYSNGKMVFTSFSIPGVGAVSNSDIPLGDKVIDGVSFQKFY